MKALIVLLVLHVWYKPQFSSASEKPTSEQMLVNVETGQYAEVAVWELLYFWKEFWKNFWKDCKDFNIPFTQETLKRLDKNQNTDSSVKKEKRKQH